MWTKGEIKGGEQNGLAWSERVNVNWNMKLC